MALERTSRAAARQRRLLPLGLAGMLALVIAQSCKGDAGEADGSSGAAGAGGSVDGSGGAGQSGGSGGTTGAATGGSSGQDTGGSSSAGNGGEGGLGGEGGALGLGPGPESGISVIYSLSPGILAGALLIDRPTTCNDFVAAGVADAFWGSSRSLFLTFGDPDVDALEPGVYPADGLPAPDSGHHGSGTLAVYDAECNVQTLTAIGGSITLSAIDGDQLSGSYDLVFAAGTLEGTLSPEYCPYFEWTDSSPPSVCW